MSVRVIRWGILGCGKIASKFASDLRKVEGAKLVAVASRDGKKRNDFAVQYHVRFAYESYEEMAASPEVDVVYVATPHGFHKEHTLLLLNHGKAVLCEKAFALNAKEAREMIDLARAKGVFLMEAFWTRFIPQFQRVKEMVDAGKIGRVKFIQADFGFRVTEPINPRIYDPRLGGGALLDIGVYPVFLAVCLLGAPDEIQAFMVPFESGTDKQTSIQFKYNSGALASLFCSFSTETPVQAVIAGTRGRLHMHSRFHNATTSVDWTANMETSHVPVHREEGFGLHYEAAHVCECLRNQLTESPLMPLSFSLTLMETLDRIREVCGIRYPHLGE